MYRIKKEAEFGTTHDTTTDNIISTQSRPEHHLARANRAGETSTQNEDEGHHRLNMQAPRSKGRPPRQHLQEEIRRWSAVIAQPRIGLDFHLEDLHGWPRSITTTPPMRKSAPKGVDVVSTGRMLGKAFARC
jgi:hypothetical protein